ncbi:MAG: hypothetical protein RQ745_04090 [Longimicrobiales bacterium]|nr:hypothetical protein [Longimicrobiales bacterium]
MKRIENRPGEIFLALFVVAGLTFTLLATVVEANSGKASRGFGDGLVNGAGWVAEAN